MSDPGASVLTIAADSRLVSPALRERVADAGGVMRYTGEFSRRERKVLRKQRAIPVSDWAQRHRVLTMSSLPGRWNNEVTPYLAGVMDAAGMPFVHVVTLCKSPQTGGSEAVHNFVGYCIDRAPGPVLYVYPDELTGRENSRDRILPMITSSPRLREYMTRSEDDKGMLRINLLHMPIYIAWARSASRLANKPIRYVIFDETDKYPETVGGKEADPISLGEARVITFSHNYKIFKISTPTTEENFIWQALTVESDVIFDYWVRCPACGRYQEMEFGNIRVPKEERSVRKIMTGRLAWYQCAHCDARWSDSDRNTAVQRGQWRERTEKPEDGSRPRRMGVELFTYLRTRRPARVGFHLPSWLSRFVSLSQIMADWFSAQGNKIKMRDFCNKHRAIPWADYTVSRKVEEIMRLRDTRPAGIVPEDAVALTIGIDTQQFGFWYEVRAWKPALSVSDIADGRREEFMTVESWQVRSGFVESFGGLVKIITEDVYQSVSGRRFVINLGAMDAMGDKTAEVYEFCRRFRNYIFPFQGVRSMTQPYSFSKIEYYPGTQKLIPGGVTLLRGNTTYYKNKLAGKLDVAPGDPGAWWFNADTTEEWGRHMTAEYVGDHGWWECRPNTPNHGWDCSVYNLVAADVLGVQFMVQAGDAQAVAMAPDTGTSPPAPQAAPQSERRARVKSSRW